MLIKARLRFSELLLGILLTVAIFAMGMTFESSRDYPSNNLTDYSTQHVQASNKPKPFTLDWFTEDGTVFFTGALVFVASIQAALFIWQLRYMRKGMRDAQIAAEAAKEAAEAAKAQVEFAKAQIEITKIGIFDLERAYLAVGPTEIVTDFVGTDLARARGHYVPSDPQELTAHLFIQNTGRTGAAIKKIYGILTDSEPIGDTPFYPALEGQPVVTDLGVAAGAESKLDPFEFKSELISEQFFWGYVEYTDIFKITHTSRFCAHLAAGVRGTKGKYQIAGSDAWRECD